MAEMETQEDSVSVVNGVGEERLLDGMAVLDFDMLCATVALQAQAGYFGKQTPEKLNHGNDFGVGVQRMWEGGVLDCCQDQTIALQTACCPCYRFGKNMKRAGFGSCLIQVMEEEEHELVGGFAGSVYLILVVTAVANYIAFTITRERGFLYLALVLTVSSGTYLGFFRRQIRKQFNIGGSDNSMDDCVYHLICPICTLCQESRTLEINNVQDGVWRGRGDTICIGSYGEGNKGFVELRQPPLIQTKSPDPCSMERASNGSNHLWSVDANHSEPLVPSTKS